MSIHQHHCLQLIPVSWQQRINFQFQSTIVTQSFFAIYLVQISKQPQGWLLTSKEQLHWLSQRKQPWVQQKVRLSRTAKTWTTCHELLLFVQVCISEQKSVWKRFADIFKGIQHAFRIGINGHFFQVSPFVFVQKQWFKQKAFQRMHPHVGSNWRAIHNLFSVIHNISNVFVANRNSAIYHHHIKHDYFERRLSDSVWHFINTIVNNWFG